MSRFMLGSPLSAVIGYFFAGWLNELYGWRMMFVVLGAPGLVLAACAWLTLKEPRAGVQPASPKAPRPESVDVSLTEVITTLWANVTFRHLLLGYSVMCFFGHGISKWQPAFLIRSFGLETGVLGTWLAVIYGLCGMAGMYWGGEMAARHAARNERLQLRTMMIVYCGFGATSALMYLASSVYVAFTFMGLGFLGLAAATGPLFATLQTLVPERMRATSIALIYLFANLIGMGLGPLAAGALSDAFRVWAGAESLRYALLALCPGYLWAGWHLWRGSLTVSRDVQLAMTAER
jgi:MFS family permease